MMWTEVYREPGSDQGKSSDTLASTLVLLRQEDSKLVVIGDLHGAFEALQAILRGVGLVDGRQRWVGGTSHLVQIGDLFNRFDGGRACFEHLLGLREEARRCGGEVTLLLGNHEVLIAEGNEAYCTAGEYLSFATSRERAAWPRRVSRAWSRFFQRATPHKIIPPLSPRLEAWMAENAPGKEELRRAFGPRGRIGRELRRFPIAVRVGEVAVVHAGLPARWARRGVAGLNRSAVAGWAALDGKDLSGFRRSALGDPKGPLWNRRLATSNGRAVAKSLEATLSHLGAKRLVIGHTPTRQLHQGEPGKIVMRFKNRLACTDVGLRDGDPATWAALVVDRSRGCEWKPSGTRTLWRSRHRLD